LQSTASREGSGDWIVVKVGDTIPVNAEIRVNVDRDWIEVTPSDNPDSVCEIHGPDSGQVIKKVSDLLNERPRRVSFPHGTTSRPDPRYKNRLVVREYLGRLRIIAINNTLRLVQADGQVTNVIGPLDFDLEEVLKNQDLYRYLNVQ
jgi:hypothetical protein